MVYPRLAALTTVASALLSSPTRAFYSSSRSSSWSLAAESHSAPSQTPTVLSFARTPDSDSPAPIASTAAASVLESRRRDWTARSVAYYSTVARESKRRSRGQLPSDPAQDPPEERRRSEELARRHYFALRKIKSGRLDHAERIYRGIIRELREEAEEGGEGEGGCDHAKLAVSTLLLALLLQRRGDVKGTRSAFLNFFRLVLDDDDDDRECACSAKVLQAYALFEMKRGHGRKSLEIVERAVRLDGELRPVLEWKQFRDVMEEVGAGRYRLAP